MILKQIQVGPMAVFAYLIGDENTGEALIVDPAAQTDEIIQEAKNDNLTIKYILNTHGHVDHVGGNADMKQKTGAQIIVHEDDAQQMISIPSPMLTMFRAKASPPPDIKIKDGDAITVGSLTLNVIHTPGHTPGCIALYFSGYVITGDTLFVGGVGRTDLPGGSWNTMVHSIKDKLFKLPDDTIVLPGHNYGENVTSTIGSEKKYNTFLK